mmetsp:Transcript_29515/g.94775  ORF Transcript_29515/g.94775 Transcript_29515/m.94775 type:complete len:354 (+) Transcript_29515:188-1249(+)
MATEAKPPAAPQAPAAAPLAPEAATSKDYYFDSYSHFSIHEEMLKDTVRTMSYRNAIMNNAHLLAGKVVMDVGCGTGILSMFAARAGAAHVIAIECSGIADQARQIIAANGLSDKITVLKKKCEEITDDELPNGITKVDCIISEWMGYFLLYESMLDTVIYARDRWLVDDGLLLPNTATLYISGIEDGEYMDEKINYWDNVYGFDMTAIKDLALLEPLVDTVEGTSVLSNAVPILELDLMTCTVEDLHFEAAFECTFFRNDYCHALVAYFDCGFTQLHTPVTFSTGPHAEYTHWKQTVFYLKDPLTVCEDEKISGTITCAPNSGNPRDLDIELQLDFQGTISSMHGTQKYRLR